MNGDTRAICDKCGCFGKCKPVVGNLICGFCRQKHMLAKMTEKCEDLLRDLAKIRWGSEILQKSLSGKTCADPQGIIEELEKSIREARMENYRLKIALEAEKKKSAAEEAER